MTVFEFRVALTTQEYERMIEFCQDGLGLEPGEIWTANGRGQIFSIERATLEIFDPQQAEYVDQLEVGQRVSGQIRFAFQVPDIAAAVDRALKHGAKLVHEPTLTPWNDLNARIQSPDGLQITLFEVKKPAEATPPRKTARKSSPKSVVTTSTSDLPAKLSQPAQRALAGAGYTSLAQLAKVTETEVGKLHGMGPSGIKLLKEALSAKGLAFAEAQKKK